MGKYGSSVVLPCWLTPEVNAETLEIRWYRPDQFKNPLLFYQNGKIIQDFQETYRNRSSLTRRKPQSTGLKEGDISLRLDNLGLSDIGIFHCYVSGDKSYDDSTVTLKVTAVGSVPLLALERHHKSVTLRCSSCGWFPRPTLMWNSTSEKGDPQSPIHNEQENGLFCIFSSVILLSSDSNLISCSVRLSEEEQRNVSLDLGSDFSDYGEAWKILFTLGLLCILALIGTGLLFYIFRYRKYKQGYMAVHRDEPKGVCLQDLRREIVTVTIDKERCICLQDLRREIVTVTIDKERCKNDFLLFNGDMVRDREEAANAYKGQGFPYELCVCGKKSFSSGCAYWEVGLKQANVPPKKSWLIGVAKPSYTIIDKKSDYTPSDGFWFLCSDPDIGLHVNNNPEVLFLVDKTPDCVGVLLDFDNSKLSFYSVPEHGTTAVHLVTIKGNFGEEVVPLFNPGIGDKAPLKINPHVKPQNEPEESANAEASNANQQV